MDEQEPKTELNAIEVTRRTVIETGATVLLLTTLPRAALAAGPVDGKVGKATLYRDVRGEVGGRALFDASAPLLPGFAKARAFVF